MFLITSYSHTNFFFLIIKFPTASIHILIISHKITVYSLPPTLAKVKINVKALLKFRQSETQSPNNYETMAMRIKYILLG